MGRVLLLVMFAACTQAKTECKPTKSKEDWLCTPDANVFCRCEGDPESEGTKKCGCDGESFGECVCTKTTQTRNITPSDPDPPVVRRPTGPVGTTTIVTTNTANTCPGTPVPVDGDTQVTLQGDTSTATADEVPADGACAVGVGKENIYELIPTDSGKLTVEMAGQGALDPTLYVREADCKAGVQRACGETTGVAASEVVKINVQAGKKYYVFADGKGGTAGAYTLNVLLEPGSFCGDGTVNDGEACDDGNKIEGDGCGNGCLPDGNPLSGAVCPGQAVHVWKGKNVHLELSTSEYGPQSVPTLCVQGDGADRIFAVVAHGTGTMAAQLDPGFDGVLYARHNSCEGEEMTCADRYSNGIEDISFPVTSGQTYWVIVDGAGSNDKGAFGLTLSLP